MQFSLKLKELFANKRKVMNKNKLIKNIEKLSSFNIEKMILQGFIFKIKDEEKNEVLQYELNNNILKNKRKLKRVYFDLKYKGYSYIPF